MRRTTPDQMIEAALALRKAVQLLSFGAPVTHVYNPLFYAWEAHRAYLERYGRGQKKILFLGMNPGPFGMAQTGIPFGEIAAVRDFLGIREHVSSPPLQHARRPVLGFDCNRSEVSGRRLWGLFQKRFGTAAALFQDHFVLNYCPLLFVEESGCNRTPDKLPERELTPLLAACDAHLRRVAEILQPSWVVGIGRFAEQRGRDVLSGSTVRIGGILHPSPASPASNKDWAGAVTRQLQALGAWS